MANLLEASTTSLFRRDLLQTGPLLAQKPWIVPIPGTTQLAHLLENNGADAVRFTAAGHDTPVFRGGAHGPKAASGYLPPYSFGRTTCYFR